MNTKKNINKISNFLFDLGFELEKEQYHITGHRTILAPDKLLLVGRMRENNLRVVIKTSNYSRGKKEIVKEYKIRKVLFSLKASKRANLLPLIPKTIFFGEVEKYTIMVTEFIPQERIFVSYPIAKQLSWLTKALEDREKLHSTISNWTQSEKKVFRTHRTENYIKNFEKFIKSIELDYPILSLGEVMENAFDFLKDNKPILEKYENYLIHSDFIPHNIRINNNSIFMLDCVSIHFGNKYEELARFLNYMLVHNPTLEEKTKTYILKNRGKEEYLDLRIMRIYKAGFLLQYYASLIPSASDYLLPLLVYRLDFWEEALRCVLEDKSLDTKILKLFQKNDVLLTSKEEINRRMIYEDF